MSEGKKYNGWSNYETWLVKLWMDNSEGDQDYYNEMAENCDRDASKLSDNLKSSFSESMPELGASVWADMLNASFSEVDWYEIAEAIIGDLEPLEEETEEAETTTEGE